MAHVSINPKITSISSALIESSESQDYIKSDSTDKSTSIIELASESHFLVKLEITDVLPLEFFIRYFENYEDDDFISAINQVIEEFMHLKVENEIIVQYLKEHEPHLLSAYDQACRKIQELEQMHPLMPSFFEMSEEAITADLMPFILGPRINISTRADLVARYIDELKKSLVKFEKKIELDRKRYKIEIEESSIRIEEIKDAVAVFEQSVVIDAVDPITQRIPAEKFIQFMNDWMKHARFITERIRLNTSYMKVTYTKLKALYDQKGEFGISLSDSDFEAVQIHNDHLAKLIDQKNTHLVEMKQIHGAAALELAQTKRTLANLQVAYQKLLARMHCYEQEQVNFTNEIVATSKDLPIRKSMHDNVKSIIDHCKAPETLQYLRVKHQQTELMKTHRVLCRQEHLMQITTSQHERNLLKLTHKKILDPSWYEPVQIKEDDEIQRQPEPGADDAIASEFDIFKAINVKPITSTTSVKRRIK